MASIYPADVNTAIVTTLAAALPDAFNQVQDLPDLTEGMNAAPVIQVYPDTGNDAHNSNTGKRTFGNAGAGPVVSRQWTFNIDIYAKQRASIGTDIQLSIRLLGDVMQALDAAQAAGAPYFGLEGIQSWTYRWERVTFEYATARYAGVRIIVTINIF